MKAITNSLTHSLTHSHSQSLCFLLTHSPRQVERCEVGKAGSDGLQRGVCDALRRKGEIRENIWKVCLVLKLVHMLSTKEKKSEQKGKGRVSKGREKEAEECWRWVEGEGEGNEPAANTANT